MTVRVTRAVIVAGHGACVPGQVLEVSDDLAAKLLAYGDVTVVEMVQHHDPRPTKRR